jgi:hypothetical protein
MKGVAIALCAALSAASALGCGGAALGPATPQHDVPVPKGEPRAEMRLRLDLTPAQGCEEAFDLAVYEDRGVDLVQWDASAGACAGRVVTIRYLPQKLSAEGLLALVRAHAAKADVIKGK